MILGKVYSMGKKTSEVSCNALGCIVKKTSAYSRLIQNFNEQEEQDADSAQENPQFSRDVGVFKLDNNGHIETFYVV